MIVLVDTSVWVEFFRDRTRLAKDRLDALVELIEDRRAATIHAVRVEVLSGAVSAPKERTIRAAFDALQRIDPDWSAESSWERLVEVASFARRHDLPIPGVVDRMILHASEQAQAVLWTLDEPLRRLARARGVELIE